MNIDNDEKNKLNAGQLENINGGYFIANGADTRKRGVPGKITATVSHYCKGCKHSWTADHADTVCPACGGTDLYTVSY